MIFDSKIYDIRYDINEKYSLLERYKIANVYFEKEYQKNKYRDELFYTITNNKNDIFKNSWFIHGEQGIYYYTFIKKMLKLPQDKYIDFITKGDMLYSLKSIKKLLIFNLYNIEHYNKFINYINDPNFNLDKEKKELKKFLKNNTEFDPNKIFIHTKEMLEILDNIKKPENKRKNIYMTRFILIIKKLGFDGFYIDDKRDFLSINNLKHRNELYIFNPKDCFDIIDRENVMNLWDKRIFENEG